MILLYILATAIAYLFVGSAMIAYAAYKGGYKAPPVDNVWSFTKSDIPVIIFGWLALLPIILGMIMWEKTEKYFQMPVIEIPVAVGEWFKNRAERKREAAKQAAVPTKSAV